MTSEKARLDRILRGVGRKDIFFDCTVPVRESRRTVVIARPMANGAYGVTGSVNASYSNGQTQYTARADGSCTGMGDPDTAVAALVIAGTSVVTGDLVPGTYSLPGQGVSSSPGTCTLSSKVTPAASSYFAATKRALYSEVMSDLGLFDAAATASNATSVLVNLVSSSSGRPSKGPSSRWLTTDPASSVSSTLSYRLAYALSSQAVS